MKMEERRTQRKSSVTASRRSSIAPTTETIQDSAQHRFLSMLLFHIKYFFLIRTISISISVQDPHPDHNPHCFLNQFAPGSGPAPPDENLC
jgi:hypothetical protein